MRKKDYISIIGCIINVLVLLSFSISYGAEVELFWDQNTEEELAGYFVYYGTSSRNYFDNPFKLPKESLVEVDGGVSYQFPVNLTPGVTYYFAVTAYDIWDFETDFSDEVYINICTDDSCDPTTTTTTIPYTPCSVEISPSSATVKSGEEVEFKAVTTCDGDEVEGNYQWGVIRTIGSSIDENTGLYTAGNNDTDSDVIETIKVTDTVHDVTDSSEVTVQAKEPPVCEITIEPYTITVDSGETITFTVTTEGNGCLESDYTWQIDTDIDSQITPDGSTCIYQAGSNETGTLATDNITVKDSANEISTDAKVTVFHGRIIGVFPRVLLASRWIPLPYVMIIIAEDIGFKATSYPTFTPDDSITIIGQIGFNNLMGVLLLLAANSKDGLVDLAVTTTNGVEQKITLTKESAFHIRLLPSILDLDESENKPSFSDCIY